MSFSRSGIRWRGALLLSSILAIQGCGSGDPAAEKSAPTTIPKTSEPAAVKNAPPVLKDEIPQTELSAVLAAHFKGLGLMEQYEYGKASTLFREVHQKAPGWTPGSINLAIALLNMTGEQVENSKKSGADSLGNFDEALQLLADVLKRDPNNRHAHYCTGIVLEQQGNLPEAHAHFKKVTELDPLDAASWYWSASTLTDPDNPLVSTSPKLAKEQAVLYEKALELDPYLTQAVYRLSFVSRLAGHPERQKELLDRWGKLNPDRPQPVPGPGNSAAKVYGEMGRYATVISPFPRPEPAQGPAALPPKFEPAKLLKVTLADGERWAGPDDFKGERKALGLARARFGAAVVSFDANGDGKADIFIAAAVVGPKGLHDVLLIQKSEGQFEDATASFGLSADQASLGAAAADFDADRQIDLFLTGVGQNRLLRNRDGKGFEDLTESLKPAGPASVSITARWLDLDQDGDLDLYVVNYCKAEDANKAFLDEKAPPPGVANTVYRNDGQPSPIPGTPAPAWVPLAVAWENVKAKGGLSLKLVPWTGVDSLLGGEAPHTGIAALDLDDDRDIDLVLSADGSPLTAVLNDRLGNFHAQPLKEITLTSNVSGLMSIDLDQDGRTDLAAPTHHGPMVAFRNTTQRSGSPSAISFESFPSDAKSWIQAIGADLDLDGTPDVVGLPTVPAKDTIDWARNTGKRLERSGLPLAMETPDVMGIALVDLAGDPLPDLLLARSGGPPALAQNQGNGHHWLSLSLGGHWRVKPELMRTNSHAIGARVLVRGEGLHVAYEHTTPGSGPGQSVGPVVLGLGKSDAAELVHLRWPDGVMQCELNVAGDQSRVLAENNRKTGSCPVLFTWNGERFVCLGDFLGGGGLGYLVEPGVYSQPDRDESVAIGPDQLKAEQGVFRLSVTEPMDEVAYLDHLVLEVVDRPPGVFVTPDERFAPTGTRPTGRLVAWTRTVEPAHATDLNGRDVSDTLKAWDRHTADGFRKLGGWIGYAEEHGIILDFADRLAGFGPGDPLILCLAGWVEYPYSQTNYAAATAGVRLQPPVIERRQPDGTWKLIEPHAGYPAGLPRMTTLDLTGKLTGDRCVLRIRTNMECYYDQAFLAVRDPRAESSLRVARLPVSRASLGHRGYTREISPDGRQPLIYDYDYVDAVPLARLNGKLTRYGDVGSLLREDDDRLCVIGPGDEARLEFDAATLPELPSGWTRSFVLRAVGYCKDADPFTATSDTVEPLPWRGMPEFPFATEINRAADSFYEAYLKEYQTRGQ